MGDFKELRSRTFHIVQYEINRRTGERMFSEQNIINGLNYRTIEKWAYIKHNKDKYDEKEENGWFKRLAEREESPDSWAFPVKAGDLKLDHWHVDLYCQKAVEVSKIAEWFGVPVQQVEVPKGKGAFWDVLSYLTHESEKQQEQGKYRYDDSEVKSNIDWRKELNERAEKKKRYGGHNLNDAEILQYEVLNNGLLLEEAAQKDPINYMKYYDKLQKFRRNYLYKLPPPNTRINYYVEGEAGVGKGIICRAIARALYPDLTDDRRILFNVGAKGAAFEGYDGQKVIIWNDRRAHDLLKELSGRENVFNIFDTHPPDFRQNIKYASMSLSNEVNIINGIQSYSDFLYDLAGSYKIDGEIINAEDPNQSFRRFPFIIRVRDNEFDILLNRGFAENTRNYKEYIEYGSVSLNFQKLQEECGANKALAREIEIAAVTPLVEKHKALLKKIEKPPEDEAAIRAKYKDIGNPRRVVIRHADGSTEPYNTVEQIDLFPNMLFIARLAA